MERAAAGIESAVGSAMSNPLTLIGKSLSITPKAPEERRHVERFRVIPGRGGRRNGPRRSREDHAVLCMTVSMDQALEVRRAVVALAGPALDLLTVTPLPGGSRVRLTAYLASDLVEDVTNP